MVDRIVAQPSDSHRVEPPPTARRAHGLVCGTSVATFRNTEASNIANDANYHREATSNEVACTNVVPRYLRRDGRGVVCEPECEPASGVCHVRTAQRRLGGLCADRGTTLIR
jgi:hypothetical protein